MAAIALALVALVALAAVGCGQGSGIVIDHAEFHPPLGSSGIGAAYFNVTSSKADRIVAVSSSEAASIEIHASVTTDGQVVMKHLETLDLPADRPVVFAPGGMHLMVFSPKKIAAESGFPITFQFESGLKETVSFKQVEYRAEHRN